MKAGEKLGRYEILERVGSGGMGEVYRSRDIALDRDVALKILLPEFGNDTERVKRFKFEAKAVSALNHPGILTIHEIVEEDGRLFIATEFVDGTTVRERIENSDLSVREAVGIAEQCSDALAVAHKANIVHRDIKPENIMIREDGYVKILDFGLAKPILHAVAGANEATVQMVKTQPGLVMGSVRYMSPEQARGKETDGRTDVWSLGIVLYEMLTGNNPFEGETISDSIAALIHKDPEPIVDAPDELRWIIKKALNKDPDERYQDIRDLALDLREVRALLSHSGGHKSSEFSNPTKGVLLTGTDENKTLIHRTISSENKTKVLTTGISGQNSSRFGVLGGGSLGRIGTALFAVAVAVIGGWFLYDQAFSSTGPDFRSVTVSTLTDNGKSHAAAVSPDGKLVVFVDNQGEKPRLLLQQIATGSAVEIVPPTDKFFLQPAFSPDGDFVYYVLRDKGVGTLYRVSTLGGPSREIIIDIDSRAAVSADGERLAFIRHDPEKGGDTVLIVNADGRDPSRFVDTKSLGYNKFIDVVWTDDDQSLLISGFKSEQSSSPKISLAGVDTSNGKPVELHAAEVINSQGWVIAGGFAELRGDAGLLFIGKKEADDNIQIWNLRNEDDSVESITTDTSDYESLSVSADGRTIIATKSDRISGLFSYSTLSNETRQVRAESRNFLGYLGVTETPDGRLLYSKRDGKEVNIYVIGKDGEGETRLTRSGGINLFPNSTPDGSYIVFSSNRNDTNGIWRMAADGSEPVALTTVRNGRDVMPQIADGGRMIVFARQKNDGSRARLLTVPVAGGKAKEIFPESETSDMAPQTTADGKKLAYISFEFDSKAAQMISRVSFAELEKGKFRPLEKHLDSPASHWYEWTPDGGGIDYVKKDGGDNLFRSSVGSGKEDAVTSFDSGRIMSFNWSADGKTVYLVRGSIKNDLVLIRDRAGA